MMITALRSVLTVSIFALLTACGGDVAPDAGTGSAAVKVAMTAGAAAAQQPSPDCQPENCSGLRIIDGNAEAFRIDAMRRAGQGS